MFRRDEVLVIGAGPAGIACAAALEEAGIACCVIDQAHVIGSTWDSLYPSLKLNTSRFYSHMPGMKFPLRYGIYASARQYHDYLLDYVARHDFNIRLGVRVERVAPVAGGWLVESSAGTAVWSAVILASGRFCQPHVARLPGIERFSGQVLHSSAFRDEADFAGQRVMVVGNGPSGVDLVVALAQAGQTPVYLAQRTGIVLKPRYPWGLPKHAWMLLVEKWPGRVSRWLERRALALEYRNVAASGIKVPGPGEMSGAAGTRGPELLRAVRSGRAEAVDTPVDFQGETALLPDGRRIALDTIILATGFRAAPGFLDFDFGVDEQGLPLREVRDFPVYDGYLPHTGYQLRDQPGLYVTGIFYKGRGAFYNFVVEARIIAQQIEEQFVQRAPAAKLPDLAPVL